MVRRSLAFSFADKYAGLLLNLVTMAIVSRLLIPAEVGLFMVASAAIILTETFRDFGVGTCIIQERELTPQFVRTAFTVIAILSALLAGGLAVAAAPIANFYGEPLLAPMLRVATISFLLAPFSNPLLALMRRDMAFDKVARIGIAAALLNSVVTVSLALLGFGALSFIYASVAAAAVMTIGALWLRPDLWVFRPTLQDWRRVVPFGAWSSVVTLLTMGFDFVPRLILGRILGFGPVGLYSRAVSLSQLPERALMNALQPVILSAMAARTRNGASLREPYLTGLANLSAVQWPALVCLALLADPVVRLLLGAQWLETIPLVRIIALASLFMVPVHLAAPVLIAIGRVRDMVVLSLITLLPCVLIVILAAHFGLRIVAFSLFVTAPLQAVASLTFLRPHVGFTIRDLGRVVRQSVLVTLGAAAAPAAMVAGWLSHAPLNPAALAVAVVGSAVGWVVGLRLTRHALDGEILQAWQLLRRVGSRPRWRLP